MKADHLLRAARRRWQAHRRDRIRIPVTDRAATVPHVYVLTPDDPTPSGGTMVMYRHVDILNAAGIPAVALHQRPGFRYEWFAHETAVASARDCAIGPTDLLVVGELDVGLLASRDLGVPHVVLNQSGYLTWARQGPGVSEHYRRGRGLRGAVAVSGNIEALLRLAFPGLPVRRVRTSLDAHLFRPGRGGGRVISYMPRRGADSTRVVLELLGGRPELAGWEFRPIHGLPLTGVAEALRESAIFLALSTHEGFGLPAAEAMACGAYVVGFHGFGGREFFLPEHCSVVETGDLAAVAHEVLRVVCRDREEPGWLADRGRRASEWITSTYSVEHERDDVVTAYSAFLRQESPPDR